MKKEVQWWLAELDQYGNPTLVDGAHSTREGADLAMYLFMQLGVGKGNRYAVARVELTEPKPTPKGVNQEALRECQMMMRAGLMKADDESKGRSMTKQCDRTH